MKKKVCVVGAGRWGLNHIRTLDNLGALSGVVESNLGKHKKIKTDYPGLSVFPSVFESFKESFDGYTVATRSVFIIDEKGIVRYKWLADNPGQEPDYQEIQNSILNI